MYTTNVYVYIYVCVHIHTTQLRRVIEAASHGTMVRATTVALPQTRALAKLALQCPGPHTPKILDFIVSEHRCMPRAHMMQCQNETNSQIHRRYRDGRQKDCQNRDLPKILLARPRIHVARREGNKTFAQRLSHVARRLSHVARRLGKQRPRAVAGGSSGKLVYGLRVIGGVGNAHTHEYLHTHEYRSCVRGDVSACVVCCSV